MKKSILRKITSISIAAALIFSINSVALADEGPYTIEFKPGVDGTTATGSMDDVTNINYGDTVTLPHVEFTNDGYYFWGWCFLQDDIRDCYDCEPLTFTSDFVASGGYHPLTYVHNDTLTLTAYWDNTPAPTNPYVDPTSDSDPEPAADSDAPAPVILTPEQQRELSIYNFVENLYVVVLNRSYENIGRTYWMDDLLNGASGTDIVRGFFGSQEFLAMNLSNEDYVRTLYRVFCNNPTPDAEGLANWTAALDNGTATRDQLVDQFAATPEWASICAFYQVNV